MAGGNDVAFKAFGSDMFADLAVERGDLAADNGLETAVLVSLFSDAYVPKEQLPDPSSDPRGWWADALLPNTGDRIGSKLWTVFDRGKTDTAAKNLAKTYIEDALAWTLDEGIAKRIDVVTTLPGGGRLDFLVSIYRPDGENIPFKFLWDGQELKRG